MGFLKDLKQGEIAEHEFSELLHKLGLGFSPNKGTKLKDRQKYDVKDIRWDFSYEIKWDLQAPQTGNIYFEHKALQNSQADFLVYKIGQEFYKISLHEIRRLLETNKYRTVLGGDQKAPGTLMKVDEFKWHAAYVGSVIEGNSVTLGQFIKELNTTAS